MRPHELQQEGRSFAEELADLLNSTVCDGVRMKAVESADGKNCVVGFGIARGQARPPAGIPLTLGRRSACGYLSLNYQLAVDEHGEHLMVVSSVIGLFADVDLKRPLFHYDYERGKTKYPEAHLQISAHGEAWNEMCGARGLGDRPLQRLHIPVGGRRYRPTIEDMVDFLVTENLADSRPGARERIEAGRDGFRRRQLRAAVRRNPEDAIEALRERGLIPSPRDGRSEGSR